MKLTLELAQVRDENKKLNEVFKMTSEQVKEQSKLFRKLKPQRLLLSTDRELYIAGEQLFKCAAPHGKQSCPRWLLNEGQFGPEGFEIHHELDWSIGYHNTGCTVAICHSCHGLASRLQQIKLAEATGEEEEEE